MSQDNEMLPGGLTFNPLFYSLAPGRQLTLPVLLLILPMTKLMRYLRLMLRKPIF